MVTQVVTCYHCDSENIVKNGKAPNGKQKYLCHDCGRQSREDPESNAYPLERREEILSAYQERSSLRGLTRTFGVSRNTGTRWLKKPLACPPPWHGPCRPRLLLKTSCSNSTSCGRSSARKPT